MSRATSYPICFPSAESYSGWRTLAAKCHEASTPCDDCTPKYKAEAAAQFRCKAEAVREFFVIHPFLQRKAAQET